MKTRTVVFVVVGVVVLVGFMYGIFVLGQNSVVNNVKPIPGCVPPGADWCQPGWGQSKPYEPMFKPAKPFSDVVNNVCNNLILAIVVVAFLVFIAAWKKKTK